MMVLRMYEPSEDSFLLRKVVLGHLKNGVVGFVLDMGTGSGVQGLAVLGMAEKIVFSDINVEAIKHVRGLIPVGLRGKAEFFVGDLFTPIPREYMKSFDLILFNPPYLPLGAEYNDPELVGGVKGVEITLRFLSQSKEFISYKGKVFFVASSLSDLKFLEGEMASLGYSFIVAAREHYFFEDIIIYMAWLSNR